VPRIDPATDVKGPLIAKMIGRRPEILSGFIAFDQAFRKRGLLDAHLLEMVRRATAEKGECRYCASLGLAEEPTDLRTEAALAFAQAVVAGVDTSDDALVDDLKPHFSDEEIVELVAWTCIMCMGGQHFGAVLGLEAASGADATRYEKWALGR
jgi:alkylhydroperoxidase family enzyme